MGMGIWIRKTISKYPITVRQGMETGKVAASYDFGYIKQDMENLRG